VRFEGGYYTTDLRIFLPMEIFSRASREESKRSIPY
jgi:hypothetical protein